MVKIFLVALGCFAYSSLYCAATSKLKDSALVGIAGAVSNGYYDLAARLYIMAGEPTAGAAFKKWNTVPAKDKLLEEARKTLGGGGKLSVRVEAEIKANRNDNALALLVAESEAAKKVAGAKYDEEKIRKAILGAVKP